MGWIMGWFMGASQEKRMFLGNFPIFPNFNDFGEIWVGLWVPPRKNACFWEIFQFFLIFSDFGEIWVGLWVPPRKNACFCQIFLIFPNFQGFWGNMGWIMG